MLLPSPRETLLFFHLIKGPCFQEERAGEFYLHLKQSDSISNSEISLFQEQMQSEIPGRRAAQRLCCLLCLKLQHQRQAALTRWIEKRNRSFQPRRCIKELCTKGSLLYAQFRCQYLNSFCHSEYYLQKNSLHCKEVLWAEV